MTSFGVQEYVLSEKYLSVGAGRSNPWWSRFGGIRLYGDERKLDGIRLDRHRTDNHGDGRVWLLSRMRRGWAQTEVAAAMSGTARPGLTQYLIQSAKDGDQSAISSVLAISQSDIKRYARRACRLDDVDDAVQEVLWTLSRHIGSLQKLASLSAWLFSIVKRECSRLARRTLGHAGIETVEDNLFFSTRTEHELRIDLANAIQSLPDHYRSIILMRDAEELTVDEIAASLRLTREAVKARLHRARNLMREYLLK